MRQLAAVREVRVVAALALRPRAMEGTFESFNTTMGMDMKMRNRHHLMFPLTRNLNWHHQMTITLPLLAREAKDLQVPKPTTMTITLPLLAKEAKDQVLQVPKPTTMTITLPLLAKEAKDQVLQVPKLTIMTITLPLLAKEAKDQVVRLPKPTITLPLLAKEVKDLVVLPSTWTVMRKKAQHLPRKDMDPPVLKEVREARARLDPHLAGMTLQRKDLDPPALKEVREAKDRLDLHPAGMTLLRKEVREARHLDPHRPGMPRKEVRIAKQHLNLHLVGTWRPLQREDLDTKLEQL